MALPRGRAAAAIAGATIVGTLFCFPRSAEAACVGTCATDALNLTPGTLSIGTLASTTFGATSLNSGIASGAANSGNWSDLTGAGAGWHGSVAMSTFLLQGPWTTVGTAVSNNASGSYTGTAGAALMTVTVTGVPTTLSTPVNWTAVEGSTTTTNGGTPTACVNGSACTITHGVTITFNAATLYTAGAVYTTHVGVFNTSNTSVTFTTTGASIATVGTTTGGNNLPTFENNGSALPQGGVGVEGTAVNFITAAIGAGAGTFAVTPALTIDFDPNNVWTSATAGANYTATAQYTIAATP